ncbi:FAD-binding protein [Bradyrhizobium sp.]|uniref:FAD-binding protein n=1 Tax=Bradyrhizobium sp. TaxID=376 RepID=UPI003C61B4EF
MTEAKKLVVIGHGAAGLAAALAAAEEVRGGVRIDITLLEKTSEAEAGGNTRFSPSYMRMAAPDRVAPGFEEDMQLASNGRADRGYFKRLADNAVETIAWLQRHGIEFAVPVYYLSAGPPRIQPVGGGSVLVEKLLQAARQAGVRIIYDCAATTLAPDDRGNGYWLATRSRDGAARTIAADAVVLATGGFQGNPEMMRQHFGAAAENIKLISPGTRFDTGDGVRMAAAVGAALSGDWNGMHAEPVDPRSTKPAPVVLVYPYGIVVDQNGDRFFDEGAGLVHETWEAFARDIHASRPNHIAYAILDSGLHEIAGFERAIRSDVPPYQADTIAALAELIEVPAHHLQRTVESFNAAATGNVARFDASRCDGLATSAGLKPSKSNWARPIAQPPYLAYPLVGAIAYTFGGVATNDNAEVRRAAGTIPGLYAAGEMTGHFYGTAPNAVAMLRALVFGRIAGREAAGYLHRTDQ